jgi:two-component system chemotaxis response regulator CheY
MTRKILIVDDSSALRQSISYILRQEGYETIEAADGLLGLEAAGLHPNQDLIITDVNMPNLDGIGFIRRVREMAGYRHTPILVLTTESQGTKLSEGKEAGATGWIVKPFSAEKLLATVRKVIG